MMTRCAQAVFWWDTEHTARCVRPDGHTGLHRDGVRWFDSKGQQRPNEDDAPVVNPLPVDVHGWRQYACGVCGEHGHNKRTCQLRRSA